MERHKGNSLLEMLLVIAVSGILIVLAIRYFSVVDLNMRVAHAISKIDILSRASYQWRDAQRMKDFDNINIVDLTAAGLVSAVDVKNPWGGVIEVGPGSSHQHVQIHLKNISKAACVSLTHHLAEIAFSQVTPQACAQGNYYGDF